MMKHPLYTYIAWLSFILLLNSACSQAPESTNTALPSATPAQPTAVAIIETTAPIPTLTPSPEPVISPTIQTSDAIDALASQTAEGYYQIGSPNAPITLVDYSDFF